MLAYSEVILCYKQIVSVSVPDHCHASYMKTLYYTGDSMYYF
ncbi:unnamed protein product [Staurois parvus]|uniref:Uncharacterized protein n=1 Tax=Staurois parvus TaxID=386267 RepID=A0ABN9GWY4_9NEOB|nr:unnamed protein product [Staurois parvus]